MNEICVCKETKRWKRKKRKQKNIGCMLIDEHKKKLPLPTALLKKANAYLEQIDSLFEVKSI
jgi:hypothetical protein